jgi:hypothetical protein
MTAAAPIPFETEATSLGPQTLFPGVRPVSMKARLEALAAHPLASMKMQKPCDIGLFDEVARNQMDLFSALNPTKPMET